MTLVEAAEPPQTGKPRPAPSNARRAAPTGTAARAPTSEASPVAESSVALPSAQAAVDPEIERLFATSCGWCHSDGGRVPGKGPRLMDTSATNEQIVQRVRRGKVGAMPAFDGQFDEARLAAIVAYIRALRPRP